MYNTFINIKLILIYYMWRDMVINIVLLDILSDDGKHQQLSKTLW